MVSLVCIGFLYLPPAWKVFFLRPESFPNDFLSVVVVYAFFLPARRAKHVKKMSRYSPGQSGLIFSFGGGRPYLSEERVPACVGGWMDTCLCTCTCMCTCVCVCVCVCVCACACACASQYIQNSSYCQKWVGYRHYNMIIWLYENFWAPYPATKLLIKSILLTKLVDKLVDKFGDKMLFVVN